MIAFLEGKLAEKSPTRVVIDVNGVGYEVHISLSTFDKLPAKGANVRLLTHHHVVPREGAQQLFGFFTQAERDLFLLLIGVSGIGPRLAQNILSGTAPESLSRMIAEADTKSLQAIPGVGKKTAERLVVELRDRIGAKGEISTKIAAPSARFAGNPAAQDAVFALISLGYRHTEAQKAVETALLKLDGKGNVEEIVRAALRRA
jgi:Holliday junction DNA helicase RuvA